MGSKAVPIGLRKPHAYTRSPLPSGLISRMHALLFGLAFYSHNAFPKKYRGGAFIGQHGSWNRSQFNGYKVAFVPFKNGKPSGPPEDFLTGFIADETKSEVYGRPVGVLVLADGSLLVADDAANTIWKVSVKK